MTPAPAVTTHYRPEEARAREQEGARIGVLRLTGWCGVIEHHVLVIGETPKRCRITVPEGAGAIPLPDGRRLHPGDTALVPRHAVRFEQPDQPSETGGTP